MCTQRKSPTLPLHVSLSLYEYRCMYIKKTSNSLSPCLSLSLFLNIDICVHRGKSPTLSLHVSLSPSLSEYRCVYIEKISNSHSPCVSQSLSVSDFCLSLSSHSFFLCLETRDRKFLPAAGAIEFSAPPQAPRASPDSPPIALSHPGRLCSLPFPMACLAWSGLPGGSLAEKAPVTNRWAGEEGWMWNPEVMVLLERACLWNCLPTQAAWDTVRGTAPQPSFREEDCKTHLSLCFSPLSILDFFPSSQQISIESSMRMRSCHRHWGSRHEEDRRGSALMSLPV